MRDTQVFISYRREDSTAYAGRLKDQLERRFGKANVFMDLDTLPPGADFAKEIEDAISKSDVVLAVIGKDWLGEKPGATGRLADPEDFVRRELATALRRGRHIIPVVVGGASFPPAELPADLQALAGLNAVQLSDQGWKQQVAQLARRIGPPKARRRAPTPPLGRYKGPKGPPAEAEPQTVDRQLLRWLALPGVALLCVGVALLVGWLVPLIATPFGVHISELPHQTVALILGGLAWAIVYIIVGIDDSGVEALAPFMSALLAYEGLTDSPGGFLRGLFAGLPTNLLLAWGIAHATAMAAAHYMHADYEGVTYVVFGAITLIGGFSVLQGEIL